MNSRRKIVGAAFVGEIILAVLFLYVIALGVVTYDEVFKAPPHWFPPPLEKEMINEIKVFRSDDAAKIAAAQAKVLDTEDFVTVPLLVHYLADKDPQMRAKAGDTLVKIAVKPYGYTDDKGVLGAHPEVPPRDAPMAEWVAAQREWRKWEEANKDRF